MTTDDQGVRQPLLHHREFHQHSYNGTPTTTEEEEITVELDPHDPDNPQDWPVAFKWSIVMLLCLMAFITTFTCISMVPLAAGVVDDLNNPPPTRISSGSPPPTPPSNFFSIARSDSSSVLLVTIWELGEAAGPLLIAPLSEIYGRKAVMNVANTMLVLSTMLAATSSSVGQLIFARALTGLSVTANVLNPAIIGDMFPPEQRGSALSIAFLAPLIGGCVGPVLGSIIAERFGGERSGWRAVVWLCAVLAGMCELCFLMLFKETYRTVIMRRKIAKLGGVVVVDGDGVVKAPVHLEGDVEESELRAGKSDAVGELKKLRDAVLRPAHVLSGSAVLMALSLLGSVLFSYYYIVSVTLPVILQERYGLSAVRTGWCFMSFTVGSAISVIVCENTLDVVYIRMRNAYRTLTNNPTASGQPEYRLPLTIIGSFVTPVAVALYGWSAELRLPLPVLLFSVSLTGVTVMLTIIPLMSYAVDAFGLYAASAITGIIVTRCLMSTFLPLLTGPLIDIYGYGWGFMAFSALSLVLAPISLIILRYGERWRQFSKYTRQ